MPDLLDLIQYQLDKINKMKEELLAELGELDKELKEYDNDNTTNDNK
jgi:cell division septum initiation protein DivIVA